MKRSVPVRLMLAVLLAVFGCGENGGGDDGSSGSGGSWWAGMGGGAEAGAGGNAGSGAGAEGNACPGLITQTDAQGNPLVIFKDKQNYSFSSSVTIQTTPVKPMSDLVFDWSGLTQDLRGRDLDPVSGIDMLEVILWDNLTRDEFEEEVTSNNIDLAYLVGLLWVDTAKSMSSARLYDVITPSGDVLPEADLLHYMDAEAYSPDSHVYSVMVAQGKTFGQGILMVHFIRPEPGETNTEVKITNDSAMLDYSVDLTSLQKIGLPPGTADITFDWTDKTILTKNALGSDFVPTMITDVMIGHYANATPADLADQFLNIDGIADDLWTAFLEVGTWISASELKNAAGEAFTGIDEEGTWVVALICGSCPNPAPWFLGILEACPAQGG